MSLTGCDTFNKSIEFHNSTSDEKYTLSKQPNRLEIVYDTLKLLNFELHIPVTRIGKKRRRFFYDVENHSYLYPADGMTIMGIETAILKKNVIYDYKNDSVVWETNDSLFYSKKFINNGLYYRIDLDNIKSLEKYYINANNQNVQLMDSILDNITINEIE